MLIKAFIWHFWRRRQGGRTSSNVPWRNVPEPGRYWPDVSVGPISARFSHITLCIHGMYGQYSDSWYTGDFLSERIRWTTPHVHMGHVLHGWIAAAEISDVEPVLCIGMRRRAGGSETKDWTDGYHKLHFKFHCSYDIWGWYFYLNSSDNVEFMHFQTWK